MAIDRIAVIGSGTMGNGIAHVCAQHGRSVHLVDVSDELLENALAAISKNLDIEIYKHPFLIGGDATTDIPGENLLFVQPDLDAVVRTKP